MTPLRARLPLLGAFCAALALLAPHAPAQDAVQGNVASVSPIACERVEWEGVPISTCRVPRSADIRIFQRRADGRPLTHPRQARERLGDGERLLMAMNAGMYHAELSPVGLYVEAGEVAAPLVTGAGPGNFGMVPNGVFWVDAEGAHVAETLAFQALGAAPTYATQSGPMLVVGGELHPRFLPGSTSRKIRNGVGVGADGVVFAKTEAPINFHAFARYFRDHEGAGEALFLDGTVSRMWSAELGSTGRPLPIGPLVAVVGGVEAGRVEGASD